MKFLGAILVLLLSSTVFSQPETGEMHWPENEAIELRKVVDAGVRFTGAQEDIAFLIPSLTEAQLAPIFNLFWRAQDDLRVALSMAFSAESNSSQTRPSEVASLRASVANAEEKKVQLVALITALNVDALSNPLKARKTGALSKLNGISLATFSQTLTFTPYEPLSFPSIIGRHGDWTFGQASLEHYVQYVNHTMLDGYQFWTRTSGPQSEQVKDFWRFTARCQGLNFRAWGMSAEIVLPDDDTKIRGDKAAASGSRSYGFFRELLVLEYLYGDSSIPKNWRGRNINLGAKSFLFQYTDAFNRMNGELMAAMINATGPQKVQLQNEFNAMWTGRRGAISNIGPTGWSAELFFDQTDLWNSLDAYAHASMGFFHALPGPPCGPGTHSVDGVCLPDVPPTP